MQNFSFFHISETTSYTDALKTAQLFTRSKDLDNGKYMHLKSFKNI